MSNKHRNQVQGKIDNISEFLNAFETFSSSGKETAKRNMVRWMKHIETIYISKHGRNKTQERLSKLINDLETEFVYQKFKNLTKQFIKRVKEIFELDLVTKRR